MNIEQTLKQLIKEAVREVIDEEIQRGRLSPSIKKEIVHQTTPKSSNKPRDPNSIIRPAELSKMLSVSSSTLWRWEVSGQLPEKIKLGGRAVGWRYSDIERWLEQG